MHWLDLNTIAFEVFGYPLSYLELIGTVFGMLSVFLASRGNILTWPTGILNEAAFFILFFQVQLYSDMYLQLYFFLITLYGWYYWKKKSVQNIVLRLSEKSVLLVVFFIIVGTLVTGCLIADIHLLLPSIFEKPAAYPYADAFTTVTSIIATILLARKMIESWILWVSVDLVSVILYWHKGIHFVMIEYVIFLLICIAGFINWRKQLILKPADI